MEAYFRTKIPVMADKKATPKKTAAKKQASKKTPVKKQAAKKPAAKKQAPKKQPAPKTAAEFDLKETIAEISSEVSEAKDEIAEVIASAIEPLKASNAKKGSLIQRFFRSIFPRS